MEIIPETEENFCTWICRWPCFNKLLSSWKYRDFLNTGFNIACIQDWMDKNQINMNSSKTEFMVFRSKQQLQTYTLNSLKVDDTPIMVKSVINFLVHTWMNFSTWKLILPTGQKALYSLYLIKISEVILLRIQQKHSYDHWYSHNLTTSTQFSQIYKSLHKDHYNYTEICHNVSM